MRAFTVAAVLANGIAHGLKPDETRTWKAPSTIVGERVAIHAGTSVALPYPPDVEPPATATMLAGRIAGAIHKGAVVATAVIGEPLEIVDVCAGIWVADSADDRHIGTVNDWGVYDVGRWIWPLHEVAPLDVPIRCSGRQGIWHLPDNVARKVAEQLPEWAQP